MNKRFLFPLMISVLFSLLLFSCGKESIPLYYDIDTAPINLDPQSASDYSSQLIINSLFEGLLRSGENGEVEPAAAESYTVSDDGLTYRFVLREDGRWSDGTGVTADDFVFAFQRLFDPATNSKNAGDFFCIKNSEKVYRGELPASELGVRAVSALELEIVLSEYNSRFLHLLTTAPAMPCNEKFFLDTKGKYGLSGKMIQGNGPFYLSSWQENALKLRRNQEYSTDDELEADSVTFNILSAMEGEATREERFLDGKTSAVATDGMNIEALSRKGNRVSHNENTVWGIVFRVEDSPFASADVRRALCYDSDYLAMEGALPDYFVRASAIVPQNIRIGEQSYRELAGSDLTAVYDPERAKELYKKGLSDQGLEGITKAVLIVPAGMGHEDYSAYLSQIWQRDLGLYLTVEVLEAEEYQQRLQSGDFDCAITALNGDYNSPYAILSQFSSGSGKNVSGYQNADFDRLLGEAVQQPDEEKAAKSYKQAEEMLLQSGVFLPLYYQSEYFVTSRDAVNVRYDFDSKMVDFRLKKTEK